MKRLLIIGIGAGNPDYITIQAVNALNRADVFFLLDKGGDKDSMIALRRDICERFVKDRTYRFVEAKSPDWSRESGEYTAVIDTLNRDKRAIFERLINEELRDGECGAFLIWGDPSLYDSTIRIVEAIADDGHLDIDYEVIPGISSLHALTARHRTPLNSIGRPVTITTGRRLGNRFPDDTDSIFVMLDADNAHRAFLDQEVDIYWGAYIGTPDEILISGRLKDVADDIERAKAEAKAAHGWIMDSYLLRKRG